MAPVPSRRSPFAHRLTGGYKCQSRPYAHRTYTPALISTYSPYCLHVTTNAHQRDTQDAAHFCACHAPSEPAQAPSLPQALFEREIRVRSTSRLAAALVRHDDHPIPATVIGSRRGESPDLCKASPTLVPYYVHDYSGSILPAIRFLYKCQATARTLLPPEAQTHATARVGRTDKSRCLVDSRRDSCQTTVPAISEQLLRSPA